MKWILCKNAEDLGARAAAHTAALLTKQIQEAGTARLLLSTGASQFTTLHALVKQDVEWDKVEMFHLDEYIDLPQNHPASFVRYLNERFVSKVPIGKVHFVDPTQGVEAMLEHLSELLAQAPIDVGLIGIGENAHIAFNDPPADFECEEAYKVVTLNEACRKQQMGEGWFNSMGDVPKQAISMTVRQILKCRHILSAVPYAAKAEALYRTAAASEITNEVPATAMRAHPDVTVYADADSAAKILRENICVFEETDNA